MRIKKRITGNQTRAVFMFVSESIDAVDAISEGLFSAAPCLSASSVDRLNKLCSKLKAELSEVAHEAVMAD